MGSSAAALQSDWKGDPTILEVRLLSAVNGTGDLAKLPLAIEFRLAPGWKIYWRTPGEAGLPPTIDLTGSASPDLVATIRWPVPQRFDVFGFDNFGYESQIILPLDLTGHLVGAPAQISAQLDALACSDICVPVMAQLDLLLSDGSATASSHAQKIARSVSMVPRVAQPEGALQPGQIFLLLLLLSGATILWCSLPKVHRRLMIFSSRALMGSPSRHQCRQMVVTGFPSALPREWFLMVGLRC